MGPIICIAIYTIPGVHYTYMEIDERAAYPLIE